ncbi:MAG: DDE-type integrase/transposase/recombinase [Sulfurisoma sp.]|nr:DDE-type integrase/transposase/recombinase [Sulfurisoma sp.]
MNCSSKEGCIKDFKKIYKNPSHPIAFSGVTNIYKYYKGLLKKNDIEKLLASVDSYTLRKEYKNLRRNPSYSHFKRYQFQIDLIDIQQLSRWNDNFKYILSCIDTFTRKAWVSPCKDKSADTVLLSFKSIIRRAKKPPLTLVADQGCEVKNKKFAAFCKEKKINFFHNFTSGHASYIERFNRTFQNILYKFLDEYETRRYIDNLQDFVNSYNNREHRMINLSPEEAEKAKNHEKVSVLMNAYHERIKKEKPKFQIDQLVRISLQKGVFHRGYKEQSSYEVFNIYDIKETLPKPLYLLESYDKKEKLKGGFYAHEITPVNSDIFKVEKVIKQRKYRGKLQYFVKWMGYDITYNSWVDASDVTKSF